MNIRKCFITLFLILCIAFSNNQIFAAEKSDVASAVAGPAVAEAEKAWLAEHPQITLGVNIEVEPMVIVDEDGQLSGVIPEIYKEPKAITGINVREDEEHYSSLTELEGKTAKIPEG